MRGVELLAPGGDTRSVKAAVLAGADAVYLGVGSFNARKRAVNISLTELEELCLIAHQSRCRVYLTFNVLALEREIPGLMDFLGLTIRAGIDAVIIQDYGLLNVIRKVFPDLEIHGSTQMTTHNKGQLDFLAARGVGQVNFSRELSLEEIRTLSDHAHGAGLKTEVFVHGAYCVSFSGQCYISGALCENSANRGACVQPCRREYRSEGRTGGTIRPLNLKDNSLYASADRLIAAGADSLKIEGRIKGFEYVYTVVTAWKEQLERLKQGTGIRKEDERLKSVFNRSFSDNLLRGRLGRDSFTSDPGDQSASLITEVTGYNPRPGEITFTSGRDLSPGQTVTIRSSSRDGQGEFVCTGVLTERRGDRNFGFRIEHRLLGKILKGQQVWSQPRHFDFRSLESRLDNMTAERAKIPLRFALEGRTGSPLVLRAEADGRAVTLTSHAPLERAESSPTSPRQVTERLAKLGTTPFYMESCDLAGLEDGLFIPMKHLNELRQEAAARLAPEPAGAENPDLPVLTPGKNPEGPLLAIAVSDRRDLDQIPDRCLSIFQLPSDPRKLAKTELLFEEFPALIPWFPSILIGDQFDRALDFLKRHSFSMIITDNTGIAEEARKEGIPWIAGPLLNATNGYALQLFREGGASGAFISTELNSPQRSELTLPEGLQLWAPLVSPTLLMKSRHCLVRNCEDCGKSEMDAGCLENCARSSEMTDSRGNRILVLKTPGDYNALYRNTLSLSPQGLNDSRVGVVLLDFRVSHRNLRPRSPGEVILAAEKWLDGKSDAAEFLKTLPAETDRFETGGLESSGS